jgi:hypothetical protein
MKHIKKFNENSDSDDIIKEYDIRSDVTYVIDTKRKPTEGDSIMNGDGDYLIYHEGEDYYDIVGVVIGEIHGNDQ